MAHVIASWETYLQAWTGVAQSGPTSGSAWVYPLRKQAADRFLETGFPTRRDEDWRFTPITSLIDTPLQFATKEQSRLTPEALAPFLYEGLTGTQLVFINGYYAPELSHIDVLPNGVKISSLAAALNADAALIEPHLGRYAAFQTQAFVALNTAALTDGAFIFIPRNTIVEAPIHLLFVSTAEGAATVSHPRNLILAEENTQATIIESYAGPAGQVYLTNAVTEAVLQENAIIDHYKVQRESLNAFHVATLQLQLQQNSNFTTHSIALGGGLVRNDSNAMLGGEGIECTLNGVYLGSGTQLIDNHTSIDHAMPHCNSHEVYKGILDGKARGVFNGKIFVHQDAQKTDAKQTNKTLLLSDTATIDTKPQLEIYADDVRCTHGATIGQLDDEALFYLRARGIPEDQARSLLVYAFAADIVSRIQVEPIRAQLDHALLAERALEVIS